MNKNNYLIFGIILLGSIVLMTSYTAPAYNQINMSLCDGYTAPVYNQINFTLGDSDACASADSCTYTSGNWNVNCADGCNITSNVNGGGNNLNISGTGFFNINGANITNFANKQIVGTSSSNVCKVICQNNGCLR